MNIEELAEVAFRTEVAGRHVDRQLRGLLLSRISPGDLDTVARIHHEPDGPGTKVALAEYQDLPADERDRLLVQAVEDVQRCHLAAAHAAMTTAATLNIAAGDLDPEYVALFAACPVGWYQWFGAIERVA